MNIIVNNEKKVMLQIKYLKIINLKQSFINWTKDKRSEKSLSYTSLLQTSCTIKGNKNEAVKKSLLFRVQILEQKSS